MKKPELLVTARSLEEMIILIQAGADAVLLGEHPYALRISGEVHGADLIEAVKYAHACHVKVYVAVNQIFSEEHIEQLPAYLRRLRAAGVDAVVFGDPAVIIANRTLAQPLELHWNGEMTSTNYASAQFWAKMGATRVVLARELNIEEIRECVEQLTSEDQVQDQIQVQVQVQVHGMTNIYHSKRYLIESYVQHVEHKHNPSLSSEQLAKFVDQQNWIIVERERRDQQYPIFEDHSGTHIMSSDDLCMLENMPEVMDAGVHSVKIEGLLKSVEYQEIVVRSYRAAIDNYVDHPDTYVFDPEGLARIVEMQDPKRELTYGFYYKEQVY
jgi:putative protease